MNPYRGDVELVLDGKAHCMRLTLGALAELEEELRADSMMAMVARFENGAFTATDLISLLLAGLRGGGLAVDRDALMAGTIEGGPVAAARAGALLLKRAFSVADEAV